MTARVVGATYMLVSVLQTHDGVGAMLEEPTETSLQGADALDGLLDGIVDVVIEAVVSAAEALAVVEDSEHAFSPWGSSPISLIISRQRLCYTMKSNSLM
jgi:hypothetical protein